MPPWLMQRRHRLESFPLGITRGIICHKILVWDVSGRFMAMTLENAGFKSNFKHSFQFKQFGCSGEFPLVGTNIDCLSTGSLEQIFGCAKMSFHKGHIK